ncbi:MAG TPA: hypothetical protein VEF34_13960 [Syntrophobacteraceae bacterium]|nr:hypothetical protein [Syntrophobacteraceae bacterium]
MILDTLEEAQAVYAKHFAEQRQAGGKSLDAWLTVRKDALRIVVRDARGEQLMTTAYEYDLCFQCAGMHEITRGLRRRLKHPPPRFPSPSPLPLRQLHMFDAGRNG